MEGEDSFTDIGFMFDSYLDKDTKTYHFSNSISVQLSHVKGDPGALQSGHYVWPAAPLLSEYIVSNWHNLPHGNTIELGAGCGLVGLVAAKLLGEDSNYKVILSDYDPGCIELLETNVLQQKKEDMAKCYVVGGMWQKNNEELYENIKQKKILDTKFDLLLGADVIYSKDIVFPLFHTVHTLLKNTSQACFLMSSSFHYDKETENSINQVCKLYHFHRKIISCNLKQEENGCKRDNQGIRIQSFHRIIQNDLLV